MDEKFGDHTADETVKATDGEGGGETETGTEDKHKLEAGWTLYYEMPSQPASKRSEKSWKSSLKSIATVHTVEDFWGVYNNVPPASRLATAYYFFKENIEPAWEDRTCAQGGKFMFTVNPGRIDQYWLNTLLACVGETLDPSVDQICGIVCQFKRSIFRISIWTEYACENSRADLEALGHRLHEVLEDKDIPVEFKFHKNGPGKIEFQL